MVEEQHYSQMWTSANLVHTSVRNPSRIVSTPQALTDVTVMKAWGIPISVRISVAVRFRAPRNYIRDILADLNECEKYTDVCSDPKFFCCMDLPPPQKFVCSPPIAAFVADAHPGRQALHPLGNVNLLPPAPVMTGGRYPEDASGPIATLLDEEVAEPLVEWVLDGVRLIKNKQRDFLYLPATVIEQWTPPALNNLRSKVSSKVKRIFVNEIRNNGDEESAQYGRRLEAEPSDKSSLPAMQMAGDVAERAARRFTEAALTLAPAVVSPALNRAGHAQCPAGFINLHTARQRATMERVPEAAGQVVGFMKQFLPLNYGGKLDPAAVAVGLATNANSFANSLSSWYKAFVALPEALQGATSNMTGINVKDDLEDLIATGANAAQPVLDMIGNVASVAQNNPLRGGEGLRGSGPIFAPVANF